MYAIAFDLKIDILRLRYSVKYNGAYDEIRRILNSSGFKRIQGSFYTNDSNECLVNIHEVINNLSRLSWFRESIGNLKVFRIEEYADFTNTIKNRKC